MGDRRANQADVKLPASPLNSIAGNGLFDDSGTLSIDRS